jgi:hypothetical protein
MVIRWTLSLAKFVSNRVASIIGSMPRRQKKWAMRRILDSYNRSTRAPRFESLEAKRPLTIALWAPVSDPNPQCGTKNAGQRGQNEFRLAAYRRRTR